MPTIVVAAILVDGGRVLLTRRRKDQHLAGLWEFPGGKLEPGEAPEEALVRECREECGIEIEVGRVYDVAFHRYAEKEVLLLFYRCVWRSGEVCHLEVDDHAWVEPRDLDRYPLPSADERVVARLRSELSCK